MRKTIVTPLLDREKADPSVSMNTISNDRTEEFENEFDEEGNVFVEARDVTTPLPVMETIKITQVTPMTIMTTKSPDGKDIAAFVLLCKDQMADKTFTLTHNYIIENAEQKKQIERNPIHDNVNYISKRLTANMIMNTIPGYITDFGFYFNKDGVNPYEKFYMFGVPNVEDSKAIIKFEFNPEIFSVLAFLDDYIVSDCHNIHDLQIATVAGYQQSGTLVTTHFIDTVDSIVSLAASDDKDSTDLAVVFKIMEFDSVDSKTVYKILTAFDFDKKYPKKKFRGYTMEKMEEEYGKDIVQYLDKDYLIIKAKNKDGICKLFFIDNDVQRRIEEMIEAY